MVYVNLDITYCYNTGNIISPQSPGGIVGCIDHSNTLTQFIKLYYLDTSVNYLVGNTNDITGILNEENLKNNNILNNFNDNWTQKGEINNGYPILNWQINKDYKK